MALANYVKFRRGTPATYAALPIKDADSLYFISEPNATEGLLYLGDKLISGSVTSGLSLSSLSDILLGENVSTNSLLIYDGAQEKWVNKPFSEIFNEITGSLVEMTGATATADGAGGIVPKPLAGDQNKFLRGDGTWAEVSGLTPAQAQELAQLRTDINTVIGSDSALSMRDVAADEVAKIVAGASSDFDTLKEIADWIADHPGSATEINTRLTTIEGSVGDLEDEIAALKAKDTSLQAQIDDLDTRLRWMGVDEDEETE